MKFDEAFLKLNWSELYLEGSKVSNPFEHTKQQQPQQMDVKKLFCFYGVIYLENMFYNQR